MVETISPADVFQSSRRREKETPVSDPETKPEATVENESTAVVDTPPAEKPKAPKADAPKGNPAKLESGKTKGQATYEAVERLVAGGLAKGKAIEEVAKVNKVNNGTVAANYYRVAQKAGGITKRATGKRSKGQTVSIGVAPVIVRIEKDLDVLRKAVKAQDAQIRSQESELAELRAFRSRVIGVIK